MLTAALAAGKVVQVTPQRQQTVAREAARDAMPPPSKAKVSEDQARPIIVPVRQNFNVTAEFFAVGTTVALTGLNTGAEDDQKVISFMLDGLQTRDVQ